MEDILKTQPTTPQQTLNLAMNAVSESQSLNQMPISSPDEHKVIPVNNMTRGSQTYIAGHNLGAAISASSNMNQQYQMLSDMYEASDLSSQNTTRLNHGSL